MSNNPCGLNGFAFLEFSSPDHASLARQFIKMGFQKAASHTYLDIHRYQQGNIDFIVNHEPNSHASAHAKVHGGGACAMGFLVEDAQKAFAHALTQGATAFEESGLVNHGVPAIEGIGGSVIYFVDDKTPIFKDQWIDNPNNHPNELGLLAIDHLTHNVHQGQMDKWAQFYENIFNFREIRHFDIEGKITGLLSRAMSSPCGKIRIPLNESKDDKSQIEEFLQQYNGEGIQHIALSTNNIYDTVASLKTQGTTFLDTPDSYYDMIDSRVPGHQEPIQALRDLRLLIDGKADDKEGLLLQIFTENVFGPVFFEIIQRLGNEGFGEGNFQALFEAIEQDQMRRGTLEESL